MGSFAANRDWIDYTREVQPVCQGLTAFPATREARDRAVQAEHERVARAEAAERQRQETAARQQREREAAAHRSRLESTIERSQRDARKAAIWGPTLLAGSAAGIMYYAETFEDGGDDAANAVAIVVVGVSAVAGLLGAANVWAYFAERGTVRRAQNELEQLSRVRVGIAPVGARGV
jgi:hypothetical protein